VGLAGLADGVVFAFLAVAEAVEDDEQYGCYFHEFAGEFFVIGGCSIIIF